MMGFRAGGQCVVVCSDTLLDATMEMEQEYEDIYSAAEGLLLSKPGPCVTTFSCRMRDYTVFVADSYAKAFRMAAEHFTPRERRSTPIEGHKRITA